MLLVFADRKIKLTEPDRRRLAAAVALGRAGEDVLLSLLDHDDEVLCRSALLVLLCLELRMSEGAPWRCFACLSSRMPCRAIGRRPALQALCRQARAAAVRRRDVQRPRRRSVLDDLRRRRRRLRRTDCLRPRPVRARSVALLAHLNAEKQDAWDLHWSVFAQRFAGVLKQIEQVPPPTESGEARHGVDQSIVDYTPETDELAFGAYVGLVREQGGSHARGRRSSLGPQVIAVPETAIRRLVEMAGRSEHYRAVVLPVIVQSLSDPNVAVFDDSVRKPAPPRHGSIVERGGAATVRTHRLGHRGAPTAEAKGALSKQGREDPAPDDARPHRRTGDRSGEAADGRRRGGQDPPPPREAGHEPLRNRAVGWLAEQYDKEKSAPSELRKRSSCATGRCGRRPP